MLAVNSTVTAQGMQVKAKAQEGLIISSSAAGTYNATADSVKTTCAELLPGSTYDLTTFLTSVSTNPAAANTSQKYTAGTAWVDNAHDAHYIVHDFYIRSSAIANLSVDHLDVKEVRATLASNPASSAAQELSKALRVGVKFGESTNSYIYAPVTGYTASYSVQKAAGNYSSTAGDRETVTPLAGTTVSRDTAITSIPGRESTPLHAQVFVWYEGEDASCISNNIVANLEALSISVDFTFNSAAN